MAMYFVRSFHADDFLIHDENLMSVIYYCFDFETRINFSCGFKFIFDSNKAGLNLLSKVLV